MIRRKQALSDEASQHISLRLLPGIIIVILQWLFRYVIPAIIPGMAEAGVLIGLAGGLAIIVWWAFFSRAHRTDRWLAVILMILVLVAVRSLVHESIVTGFQGMMYFVYAVPVLSLAFVVWAIATRRLPARPRRVLMAVTILLACGMWTLLRSDGITGYAGAYFRWRWAETPEQKLMAGSGDEQKARRPDLESLETEAEWAGFRGSHRDGVVSGVKIRTDWAASPPVELWRQPVGPGCSSFAVHGNFLYTQEQRGDDEMVSCYNLSDGKPVWRHGDTARFWDSHAGAGPRATPTLYEGRVYTFGATGILNALDSRDGSVVWSRNAATDTKAEHSGWGYTSSPLVAGSVVIIAAAGTLAAYDLDTGKPRWVGPDGGKGYSSPHLLTLAGTEQVLLLSEVGVTSVLPADGTVLWKHEWPEERIVQPALTEDGDILLSAGGMKGIRRLKVRQEPDGWKIEECWTSLQMKPSFNDIVVHKGHVFGFLGPNLTCIDISDGKRKWRGGRYGGQILLLPDQDLLLVLSEKGELALVRALPDKFEELARFPAIEGKTWNHHVLVGDILLVRNAQEMAAFRLPSVGS
jgi:outer membrane protein assembly factor BamB